MILVDGLLKEGWRLLEVDMALMRTTGAASAISTSVPSDVPDEVEPVKDDTEGEETCLHL